MDAFDLEQEFNETLEVDSPPARTVSTSEGASENRHHEEAIAGSPPPSLSRASLRTPPPPVRTHFNGAGQQHAAHLISPPGRTMALRSSSPRISPYKRSTNGLAPLQATNALSAGGARKNLFAEHPSSVEHVPGTQDGQFHEHVDNIIQNAVDAMRVKVQELAQVYYAPPSHAQSLPISTDQDQQRL